MALLQQSIGEEEKSSSVFSVESEIIEYFVSFVRLLGLPRSVGQIYGLLFSSVDPLSMDDIIERLEISKGSASQGLNLLRSFGAVTSHGVEGERKEFFVADLQVSRIVNHFYEKRLQPRLDHGGRRIDLILDRLHTGKTEEDQLIADRVKALKKWQDRGRSLFPRVMRWLWR